MSIADEIIRLQGDSSDIADAIAAKGVTVPAGSGYDDYAGLIASIPSGGSSTVDSKSTAGTNTATITFTDLGGEPLMFALQCGAYPGSDGAYLDGGTNRIITSVISNGTDVYSTCLYKSGSTTREYIYTGCTFSYNNGTLTITSPNVSTAGAFRSGNYKLFYVY